MFIHEERGTFFGISPRPLSSGHSSCPRWFDAKWLAANSAPSPHEEPLGFSGGGGAWELPVANKILLLLLHNLRGKIPHEMVPHIPSRAAASCLLLDGSITYSKCTHRYLFINTATPPESPGEVQLPLNFHHRLQLLLLLLLLLLLISSHPVHYLSPLGHRPLSMLTMNRQTINVG